jgi:hypothetical protein
MPRKTKKTVPLGLKLRSEAQATFLEAFAECGIIRSAAKAAGIARQTVYDWKNNDPAFAARYEVAEADANDVLREEIRRRAVDGWDEPVYQGGDLVGTIRRYDSGLLKFIAQSRMPEFRDRLDVTSGDETLGAHERINAIVNDPQAASLACDLLSRVGRSAPTGGDASGPSDSGE